MRQGRGPEVRNPRDGPFVTSGEGPESDTVQVLDRVGLRSGSRVGRGESSCPDEEGQRPRVWGPYTVTRVFRGGGSGGRDPEG